LLGRVEGGRYKHPTDPFFSSHLHPAIEIHLRHLHRVHTHAYHRHLLPYFAATHTSNYAFHRSARTSSPGLLLLLLFCCITLFFLLYLHTLLLILSPPTGLSTIHSTPLHSTLLPIIPVTHAPQYERQTHLKPPATASVSPRQTLSPPPQQATIPPTCCSAACPASTSSKKTPSTNPHLCFHLRTPAQCTYMLLCPSTLHPCLPRGFPRALPKAYSPCIDSPSRNPDPDPAALTRRAITQPHNIIQW
jgi:hypothetical protein